MQDRRQWLPAAASCLCLLAPKVFADPGEFLSSGSESDSQQFGMHACPHRLETGGPVPYAMAGAQVAKNIFLCSKPSAIRRLPPLSGHADTFEYVDGQDEDIQCSGLPGSVSRKDGTCLNWKTTKPGSNHQRAGMHACPSRIDGSSEIPWVMIGYHAAKNALLCRQSRDLTAVNGAEWIEIESKGSAADSQRENMHACPEGMVMTGIHLAQNRFLCGGWVPAPGKNGSRLP